MSATTNEPRPYWIPATVDFDRLPDELKAAISAIVNPAYQELVLKASPGLQQSTGLTIVHLLWLEISDQIELGHARDDQREEPEARREYEKTIDRLLRLAGAKQKMSGLLLRLHEFKQRWGTFPVAADPFAGNDIPQMDPGADDLDEGH